MIRSLVIFSFAAIVTFMSSCTSTNKSVSSVPIVLKSAPAPLEVDYNVDISQKLQGTSKATYLLGLLRLGGDNTYADGMSYSTFTGQGYISIPGLLASAKIARVKAAAAYKAVASKDADFIANPNYTIRQTRILFGLVSSFEANVIGWSGKYTKAYKGEKPNNLIFVREK